MVGFFLLQQADVYAAHVVPSLAILGIQLHCAGKSRVGQVPLLKLHGSDGHSKPGAVEDGVDGKRSLIVSNRSLILALDKGTLGQGALGTRAAVGRHLPCSLIPLLFGRHVSQRTPQVRVLGCHLQLLPYQLFRLAEFVHSPQALYGVVPQLELLKQLQCTCSGANGHKPLPQLALFFPSRRVWHAVHILHSLPYQRLLIVVLFNQHLQLESSALNGAI
mmetsp:Transcript_17928/g.29442  ORF Transcript_17928/g.29442 Transcript_17928/m.29442 type:complete len:219 (+) Transcript_17928:696-1352(+)